MTSTVVIQLVEQGKLGLDAPIAEYLPDLALADKKAQETITVRHLLTHQSGLEGDIFDDTGVGDDALEKLLRSCCSMRRSGHRTPRQASSGAIATAVSTSRAVLWRTSSVRPTRRS